MEIHSAWLDGVDCAVQRHDAVGCYRRNAPSAARFGCAVDAAGGRGGWPDSENLRGFARALIRDTCYPSLAFAALSITAAVALGNHGHGGTGYGCVELPVSGAAPDARWDRVFAHLPWVLSASDITIRRSGPGGNTGGTGFWGEFWRERQAYWQSRPGLWSSKSFTRAFQAS